MLLYIRARTVPPSGRQRFYYVAALIVTVVAMKTKEIAFTLPVIEEGRRDEAIREYRELHRYYPNDQESAQRLKQLAGQ